MTTGVIVIFDLLKSSEHGLAVSGNISIVQRLRLTNLGAAPPARKNNLKNLRTD